MRVGGRDAARRELRDLSVFEADPRFRLKRAVRATWARVAGERWELGEARERRLDPALPTSAPRATPAPAWIPAPVGRDLRARPAGASDLRRRARSRR